MSQFSAQGTPSFAGRRSMPRGEEVASFTTYDEAQFAVDSLSDDGFPVQVLAIIGTDLRQVENITGRMSWGRAAIQGAGSGLWLGIFFAAMMSLIGQTGAGGATIAFAILLGVVWGMIFQLLGYALTRGRRDFTSTSHVVASRYSIIASEQAGQAAQALADVPGNLTRGGAAARRAEERRAARAGARADGPTAFGSRPDEQPRFGVRVADGDRLEEPESDGSAPARLSDPTPVAPAPQTAAGHGPGADAPSPDQGQDEGTGADASERDPYARPSDGGPRA